MANHEDVANAMEAAAIAAKSQLDAGYPTWSAQDLARWFAENYLKAGHKRLGRMVVDKVAHAG